MAYIYQIQNDINGKVYIGKTEHSIEKRWKEHCNDYLKDHCEKRPLYSAMKKYGIEHFHISLVEETEAPEEREQYWIEKLGSFKNGYNATRGGDGKKYLDYDLIIKTYRETKNQSEVARLLKIDPSTVRKVLNNYIPNEILNAEEKMKTLFGKAVAKIDPITNEILKIYSSIAEAEKKNNISKHIASVCKGKRKTAGGFKWKYLE